ncbi:putative secreted lipase [Paramyrothecium foliicola]|nr:putative secreted lipase [Paramyrothecium foliicola]
MVSFTAKTAALVLAFCQTSCALTATILADTNRDGVVDVTGISDIDGKNTWTAERGALFLPNVVDTDRRCSLLGLRTVNMHTCHDATDNVLRQAKYLAPIRTLPAFDVGNNAFGVVNVTSSIAAERVRIFFQEGDTWSYVEDGHHFTAEQLKAGLTLGIDGRDTRRPDVWDGKAVVHFTITDGTATSTDSVELRVAPFLTHHHAQLAQQAFGSRPGPNSLQVFNDEFAAHNTIAGISRPPIFLPGREIWPQDSFETGYASIPGPDGPVVIRILLMAYGRRNDHVHLFNENRNSEVGAINFPQNWNPDDIDFGSGTWDSTGNLETIPPYTHDGKSYPAGRIIMGEGTSRPSIVPFLQSQEVQDPLILDTSWLRVGHVDEFIQFLPANNERGWVVMADDPLAGLDLLKSAAAAGHGGVRALSRNEYPWDPLEFGVNPPCTPKSTINFELSRANLDATNQWAAERIEFNLDIIKRETGVTDDEIFRVPGIFNTGSRWSCRNSPTGAAASARLTGAEEDIAEFDIVKAAGGPSDGLRRRQAGASVHSHYPAAINGVVLNDTYYLSPNPWGPIIDGVDIFAEAISAAYAKVNFTTITSICATLLSVVAATPIDSSEGISATATVIASAGTVIGSVVDDVEYFRGIPYGQPPVGPLRLRPPKAVKTFGRIQATGVGPACPQFTNADPSPVFNTVLGIPGVVEALFMGSALGNETEDCLTVSVMRPHNTKPNDKLPVLFWMHGGGFQLGSAQPYNASVLIPRAVSQGKPFILVGINYRLGGFGFLGGKEILADGAANLGLLDQRLALEWVADNIAAFGGDPNAVTIWGESAGSMSVFSQMALYDGNNKYKGRPLFRGAIMNSGSLTPAEPVNGARAQEIFDTVVREAGCGTVPDAKKVDCLRSLDYKTFTDATTKVPSFLGYHSVALSYAPRPDGRIITASAEVLAKKKKYAAVPMIIGNQENEGTIFGLFPYNVTTKAETISYMNDIYFRSASRKQVAGLVDTYPYRSGDATDDPSANNTYPEFSRLSALVGDYTFSLISRVFLDLAPKTVPAWSYLATYGRGTPILGTYHVSDLPRIFYQTDEVSRGIQDRYIAFVDSLDPNDGASTRWPTWHESRQLLEFGAGSTGLLSGDFRSRSYKYLRDNLKDFRL